MKFLKISKLETLFMQVLLTDFQKEKSPWFLQKIILLCNKNGRGSVYT